MSKGNKGGRPTAYKPEYCEQAAKLCRLGATDEDLADFFGVSDTTIDNWKAAYPEFLGSLKEAKEIADNAVERSLFERATGYSHPAVKIITVSDGGNSGSHVEQIPYTERYPPDTTAQIFWLKNRRKDRWRDKTEHEHSGTLTWEQVLTASRNPELISDLPSPRPQNGQHRLNGVKR